MKRRSTLEPYPYPCSFQSLPDAIIPVGKHPLFAISGRGRGPEVSARLDLSRAGTQKVNNGV
jgi:hypothetical protein